jgi:hypothetical protein
MINLVEIVNDPDLAQPFTIYRTTGVFGLGGWIPNGIVNALGAFVHGEGYTTAPGLSTSGGSGNGCTLDIVAVAGIITSLAIRNPGSKYNVNDILVILQGGNNSASVVVSAIAPLEISVFGVIAPAEDEDLLMIPEGDRVTGAMVFYTEEEVWISSEKNSAISDQIMWRGNMYRLHARAPWIDFGFYKVIGSRMKAN